MMITLSKRLSTLVSMIPKDTILYDIGCDHGYTSITAVQKKICQKAFACDVRTGPLQAAANHVKEAGLQDSIQTVLSDGLKEILQVEADSCVLISGMGGELMSFILNEALESGRFRQDTVFILQPQSELGDFRRFLYKNGMIILDEDMIYEEGKYYPMMKVCFEVNINRKKPLEAQVQENYSKLKPMLSEEEYEYGPILLYKKNEVLMQFLSWKKELLLEVLNKLKNQVQTVRIRGKIEEVDKELSMIESVYVNQYGGYSI